MLEISDLSVTLSGREVLAGLSLAPLRAGEVTVLAGPNAAGKSTALRAIAQSLPYRGALRFAGADLARQARIIGMMPQTLPAGNGLLVLETVLAALRAAGPASHAQARAVSVLARLGLSDLAMTRLDRLSGGQRQMVSLACAIVRDPKILLLDEPTSALDLARQIRLLAAVKSLAREGRVVLAVLHDLALAARHADRIVLLHQGRCLADGAPEAVLTPQNLARAYGVRARVERCSQGALQVLVDGEIG